MTTPPRAPSLGAYAEEPLPRSPAENLYRRRVPNAMATLFAAENADEDDVVDDGASRRARAASRARTPAVTLMTKTTRVDAEVAMTALALQARACSSAMGSTRVARSSSIVIRGLPTKWMRSAQQPITCIWNALARMSRSIPERRKRSVLSLAELRLLPAHRHDRGVAAGLERRAYALRPPVSVV